MKILYLITGLRLGGAEKQLLLLCESMRLAGNKVLVVAMEQGGVLADEFRSKGINVVELGITGVTTVVGGYGKFKAVVSKFAPQVIHSHMIHANFLARAYKFFNKNVKVISTAHNIREGGALMMAGYRLTSRLADWSTNVSKEAYNYFVKESYFDARKSSYVPNAIDTEKFSPQQVHNSNLKEQLDLPADAYIYFTAGRLHAQKNHRMLLKAFTIVKQRVAKAVLIIAGEGPLQQELQSLTKQLGLDMHVKFLGRRNDMPALLSMCNCFVLSSDFEGFGLVIGEAMAMLKPVVATDCGGVKEVMGGFGKLVNVGDEAMFGNAMIAVYQEQVSLNQLREARMHIVKNYSVAFVINQWMKLYAA